MTPELRNQLILWALATLGGFLIGYAQHSTTGTSSEEEHRVRESSAYSAGFHDGYARGFDQGFHDCFDEHEPREVCPVWYCEGDDLSTEERP